MYSDEAKIKPCLRNIPFDSEGDVSQLPETGVLSILQFTLHPGVDLLQPLQPVSSLWRDSLEFISTMPGFQGLYWAPVSQDTVYQQIIIILVQWENGLAWRRFQCSIGFSMLLGYLAESFNRCIELSLPTGLSSSKSLLELVSYRYPPRLSSTGLRSSEVEEEKQRFKEVWGLSVLPLASITPSQSGRIFAFGGWLQRDSPLEDQIFIGLLFWGDTQPGRQQDQTAFDVVTRLNELSKDATSVVSCITMPLCYIPTGYSGAKKPTKPSTDSPPWKHPLLKVNVTPIYEPTESTGPGYADQVHLKSVTEAKAVSTTRISAGPARRWYCMGLLNQHYMPKRPEFTPKATLELITFRVRSGTSIAGAFKDLRLRLWNLAQDSEVRWGIDHENVGWYTRYSLLINPRGVQLNNVIQAEFQNLIHEFARQCGDKILDMSQRRIRGPSELRLVKNLEISTFYIPANDYDKVSFEYGYTLYIGSSFAQLRDGISLTETPAARPTAHGWAIENNLQSDPETVPFTSVFSWKSQAARQEWYGDYARRVRAEFNRLGHIIDWLQTLCKRVDIQFLLLEEEDSEISEAILKSMMQNLSQPHKPVFTLW